MKKLSIYCLIGLLAMSCGTKTEHSHDHEEHLEAHDHSHDHEPAHNHEHDHAHEHNHSHGQKAEAHDHAGEIDLHDEVAERFGVVVSTLEPGDFHTVVSATGQVLTSSASDAVVSAPTAGIVNFAPGLNAGTSIARGGMIATVDGRNTTGGDSNIAQKAALDAAQKELKRIESLYADQLATIGELNAAQAAFDQAKAAYSPQAASGRATAPISGVVTALLVRQGEYVEVGQAIASITGEGGMTIRVDLPQKYYDIAASLSDAVLDFPYLDECFTISSRGGRRTAATALPQTGTSGAYIPVYFTLPKADGIIPGSTCSAKLTGDTRNGVLTVPVDAISEQQGEYFVYERVHPESYIKRRVTLGDSDGMRVEIRSGIEPGKSIVTHGATTVRLAESGAAIPEGHTHNH